MILHASIVADDPRRTAQAIARLWAGEAFPIPGPGEGSWGVITDRRAGDMVEVLKRGTEFHIQHGGHVDVRSGARARAASGMHLLLETPLGEAQILAAAKAEGLPAWRVNHGFFSVYEVWLDECFLLELVTPAMAAEYRAVVNIDNARQVAMAQA